MKSPALSYLQYQHYKEAKMSQSQQELEAKGGLFHFTSFENKEEKPFYLRRVEMEHLGGNVSHTILKIENEKIHFTYFLKADKDNIWQFWMVTLSGHQITRAATFSWSDSFAYVFEVHREKSDELAAS